MIGKEYGYEIVFSNVFIPIFRKFCFKVIRGQRDMGEIHRHVDEATFLYKMSKVRPIKSTGKL
jgi:hypothetical protein